MRSLRTLLRCREGAAIVEFALLAPAFFILLFGIIEGSRLLWTQQTLDEVAFSTARCMAVSEACASTAGQRAHAVSRAGGYGIAISAGEVTAASGVNCNGFPDSSRIIIRTDFPSVLSGFVPDFPDTIRSQACFPEFA